MEASKQTNLLIDRMSSRMNRNLKSIPPQDEPMYLGIDIGTANVVSLVIDKKGRPVSGEIESAHVVREGMIVDYFHALSIVEKQIQTLNKRLDRELLNVVSAVPPGTEHNNGKVTRNLLEGAGLNVLDIIDEPSAAAKTLDITDGAVVDVGGGTTGISILKDSNVIYTADESTGGFHLDLVLAGGLGISIEEAEAKKCDPAMQKKLFPVVKPVFEKIITITRKYIEGYHPEAIYLVGGTCTFPGFAQLMEKELKIPTILPHSPLLVTPLGMAIACRQIMQQEENNQKGDASFGEDL